MNQRELNEFRDGIFALRTRRFGTVAEIMIKHLYDLDESGSLAFDKRAREIIASNKSYQKYNVPVEYLTLYGIATRGVSCLEFKYELKKID